MATAGQIRTMVDALPVVWTELSRGGMKRTFTVMRRGREDSALATARLEDVLYWRWLGETDAIEAVDPNDGPFLSRGYRIGGSRWTVRRILSVEQEGLPEDDAHTLVVLLEVEWV